LQLESATFLKIFTNRLHILQEKKINKWEATKNEAIEAHQNQDNVIKKKFPSNQMLDYVTIITIMKQLLIDGIVIKLE